MLPARQHVVIDKSDAPKVLRQRLLLGRRWIEAEFVGAFGKHHAYLARRFYTNERLSGFSPYLPDLKDGISRRFLMNKAGVILYLTLASIHEDSAAALLSIASTSETERE